MTFGSIEFLGNEMSPSKPTSKNLKEIQNVSLVLMEICGPHRPRFDKKKIIRPTLLYRIDRIIEKTTSHILKIFWETRNCI